MPKKITYKDRVKPKFTISDFNKKYGTNYSTFEEFTTQLPDEETRTFFKNQKNVLGSDHQAALLTMQKIYGNPSVSYDTSPLITKGRAFYESLPNRIRLNSSNRTINPNSENSDISAFMQSNRYLAELAHSAQNNSNKNFNKDFLKDILYHIGSKYNVTPSPYNVKGTLEYQAHKVIEPYFKKQYLDLLTKERKKY